MKSLHIRELPEETLFALKRRAERHHRSLQKEIRVLLQEAAHMQAPEESGPPELRLRTVSTCGTANWDREGIYGDDAR